MAAVLTEFLRRAAAEPFAYGEWDCAMMLANWVRERSGADPAARLRGHYRTRLGWIRIVRREGGLVALVDGLAVAAGMRRVAEPTPGCVAVIETTLGQTGAIRCSRGWAIKTGEGIVLGPAKQLAAWDF